MQHKNNLAKDNHVFDKSILRSYDIRGEVGKTLDTKDAYHIGRAYGSMIRRTIQQPTVCVGYDGRISSPELEKSLIEGLIDTGVNVIRIGLGPTPMLYFSVQQLSADGGIMITGSHNPPSHNGFKIMKGMKPFFGQDILELGKVASSGEYKSGKGNIRNEDVNLHYLNQLLSAFSGNKSKLKVAWDPANGAAGKVTSNLINKLPGEHILINEKIDGSFPSHHPDPTVPKNMEQLIEVVKYNGCDLGIGFDGDGDRIGVVDKNGNMVYGDQILTILSQYILKEYPGSVIIGDVKSSDVLFDQVSKNGGKPLMWKTGHSLIKTRMLETIDNTESVYLAGEMSGHIFFKNNYCFDDGLYAAVKLINYLNNDENTLEKKLTELPKVVNTPEIRVEVSETNKFDIILKIKHQLNLRNVEFNDMDGVRVSCKDGWWLIRASNTEAALIVRCESFSDIGLSSIIETVRSTLNNAGVNTDDLL
ncbi:MAG: phosphomannomutase/phosphoglucomutase [Proteobacteria bacterium]|nr:phosphomannomutase/phosphoglucomutase [Pseudomonadota bacterium]